MSNLWIGDPSQLFSDSRTQQLLTLLSPLFNSPEEVRSWRQDIGLSGGTANLVPSELVRQTVEDATMACRLSHLVADVLADDTIALVHAPLLDLLGADREAVLSLAQQVRDGRRRQPGTSAVAEDPDDRARRLMRERYARKRVFGTNDRVEVSDLAFPLLVPPGGLTEGSEARELTVAALLDHCRNVLIEGPAGVGKSTLLQRLALDELARPSPRLPLLVRAAELASPDLSLLDLLVRTVEEFGWRLSRETLTDLLAQGRCLVLFDAIDELAFNDGRRREVASQLRALASQYQSRVLVTTRSSSDADLLEAFDHVRFGALDDAQVEAFLDGWASMRGFTTRRHQLGEFVSKIGGGDWDQVPSLSDQDYFTRALYYLGAHARFYTPQMTRAFHRRLQHIREQTLVRNPFVLSALCLAFEAGDVVECSRGRLLGVVIEQLVVRGARDLPTAEPRQIEDALTLASELAVAFASPGPPSHLTPWRQAETRFLQAGEGRSTARALRLLQECGLLARAAGGWRFVHEEVVDVLAARSVANLAGEALQPWVAEAHRPRHRQILVLASELATDPDRFAAELARVADGLVAAEPRIQALIRWVEASTRRVPANYAPAIRAFLIGVPAWAPGRVATRLAEALLAIAGLDPHQSEHFAEYFLLTEGPSKFEGLCQRLQVDGPTYWDAGGARSAAEDAGAPRVDLWPIETIERVGAWLRVLETYASCLRALSEPRRRARADAILRAPAAAEAPGLAAVRPWQIRATPLSADTYAAVASCRSPDDAMVVLDRGLSWWPGHVASLRRRAQCLAALGRSAEARRDLAEALESARGPQRVHTLGIAAGVYTALGDRQEAMAACDTALRELDALKEHERGEVDTLSRGSARAGLLGARGVALMRAERYAEAIPDLQCSIQLDASQETLYGWLAAGHMEVGNTDQAIETYREAIRRDPNYFPGLVNLAGLLLQQEQPASALEALEMAVPLRNGKEQQEICSTVLRSLLSHGSAREQLPRLRVLVEALPEDRVVQSLLQKLERGEPDR